VKWGFMNDQNNEDSAGEFFPAEIMSETFANRPATTTLLDSVFLPTNRIPKDLINQISGDKSLLQQQLLTQAPLLLKREEKPYWRKGGNKRKFDAITLQVYSSVCVADDRHLLEAIVSVGGMYADLSGLTLRQAIELAQINASYNHLPQQYSSLLDTKMFSGIYDYFLCDFSTLFEFLNLKNQKANKATTLNRLVRLSQMLLVLDYEKEGKALHQYHTRLKLVDGNYVPFLVLDSVKNKLSVKFDSITHLIVGVHKTFTASLKQEGAISRKRFLSVYPRLSGKHAITDFCKYLDSHKRSFVHGKSLRALIISYYNNKVRVPNQHFSRFVNNTLGEVLEKREILLRDFNLLFKPVGGNNSPSQTDYTILYTGDNSEVGEGSLHE